MCVEFSQGPVVVDRTSLKSLRVNSPVLGANPSLGIFWRYRLTVRTWDFESCNPGSNPGNASIFLC